MVWTRLLYTTLPKAFERTRIPGTNTFRSQISGRYRAVLRKTFRLNGVPWIYDADLPVANNPRDRKPKLPRSERDRPLQLAKIEKNLEDIEAKKQAFRKQRLDGRALAGWDKFVNQVLPSLIKKDTKNVPKHLRRRADNDDDDDDWPKNNLNYQRIHHLLPISICLIADGKTHSTRFFHFWKATQSRLDVVQSKTVCTTAGWCILCESCQTDSPTTLTIPTHFRVEIKACTSCSHSAADPSPLALRHSAGSTVNLFYSQAWAGSGQKVKIAENDLSWRTCRKLHRIYASAVYTSSPRWQQLEPQVVDKSSTSAY